MTDESAKTRIVVLGLGNVLMTDDGVGVHAIRRLEGKLSDDVACVEIGTASLRAEAICEQADIVIAIDAVQAGGRPGSICVFEMAEAEMPPTDSLHNLSLAGVLGLMPVEVRPRGIVVGVEPARVEYGLALSARVEAAMSQIIRVVCEIVDAEGRLPCVSAISGRPVGGPATVEENS